MAPEGGEPATLIQSGHLLDIRADAIQAVFRSPGDWEEFIASYPTTDPDYLRFQFSRVDYGRYMVVGLSLGPRGSGSIKINIDSVRVKEDRLVVFASEIRPEIGTRDMAHPAHFVVVEQSPCL